MRITASVAKEEIQLINNIFEKLNHPRSLQCNSRNGYSHLDEYTEEGKCLRTLHHGTPAECVDNARAYLLEVALQRLGVG